MPNREKVLNGLRCCTDRGGAKCTNCPYCMDSPCVETLNSDAFVLLKEPIATSWINVKDRFPNKNGSYLVVYNVFQRYTLMDVKRFAKDLYSVDKYAFPNEHRPGWYEYDNEYGYIERNDITHWMPLPKLPKEDG